MTVRGQTMMKLLTDEDLEKSKDRPNLPLFTPYSHIHPESLLLNLPSSEKNSSSTHIHPESLLLNLPLIRKKLLLHPHPSRIPTP